MAQAQSISLSHFTAAVQAAVKAAVQKHPKFKLDAPQGVTFSFLIRGIPVPESVLANVTLGETQDLCQRRGSPYRSPTGRGRRGYQRTQGSALLSRRSHHPGHTRGRSS